MASSDSEMRYRCDNWPRMPNGDKYDGLDLLTLVRRGSSPFDGMWDVNCLIKEVEDNLAATVVDIPRIHHGSNNYGVVIVLSTGATVVARMARNGVNMPGFDGFPFAVQLMEHKFEVAVCELLRKEERILAPRIVYSRAPIETQGPKIDVPADIAGRRLIVYEKTDGEKNVWKNINLAQQCCLLAQAANIRASLYKVDVPTEFAETWLRERLFEQKPKTFPVPVAPTREFCIAMFTSKIEATIKNLGDVIGWEEDNNRVGPVAAAAKQSLLKLIPLLMPATENNDDELYRFVIEHGDFGIHNMSIAMDGQSMPRITSVFDWETACIVPALLSNPQMSVTVDLTTDENAEPTVGRRHNGVSAHEIENVAVWSSSYFERLFHDAPGYKRAIQSSIDARHLWFALQDWRGDDAEDYFGELGAWAKDRHREMMK